MKCHGVFIMTTILISDTAKTKDCQSLDNMNVNLTNEQTRIFLEYIPISVFKVGILSNTKYISIIAELVSDYHKILLILNLFNSIMPMLFN